jgi:colicin import membrane protein
VTTLQQHVDDLEPQTWAALTKRVAEHAVAAAERLGTQRPSELAAVAAMSESELVEHCKRSGPVRRQRPTAKMKLIEADRLRALAERRARDAHQDKQDADAAASVARAQAQQSARAADAAREKARTAEAHAAHKDVERTAELEQIRAELVKARAELAQLRTSAAAEVAQLRTNAAAEVAAASQHASAAETRAEQRAAERAAERQTAQQAIEQLRGELAQVRASAAAEIAAACEQASAAEARAEQRTAERTAERQTAQQAIEQLRSQLAQVRANADAGIYAAREQAGAEIAAARQAAEAQIARVHGEAQQLLDEAAHARARAEADADNARRQAEAVRAEAVRAEAVRAEAVRAEAVRAEAARAAPAQLLTIPIPPPEVRPETRRIENALNTLHQITYVLEVGMAEDIEPQIPLDVELVRSLVTKVQRQATDLTGEWTNLPARFSGHAQDEAADFAAAAADAYRAFLQRIDTAAQRLRSRDTAPDADIVEAVTTMLADPRVRDSRTA